MQPPKSNGVKTVCTKKESEETRSIYPTEQPSIIDSQTKLLETYTPHKVF